MKSPVEDYLAEVLASVREDRSGAVADYIPELATAPADRLGIALCTPDGRVYAAGDADTTFTIQSISKPFAYAAALIDRGPEVVRRSVGVEPSGEAFNELSLEKESRRPKNPMINAGAITTHQLLVSADAGGDERVHRVQAFFSQLANRELVIDEDVCASELSSADRNLALAHMLRNYGIIDVEPHRAVVGYIRQCSVSVSVRDLAVMCATLANAGRHPQTGETVMDAAVARQTMAVMAAAGMYDSAGEWFTTVGIPAKSGVAGGLIGALPGQCGIAVFSPRLDPHGNSVRGTRVFARLSDDMGMHLMGVEPSGASVLRDVDATDAETILILRGPVQFSGAEVILRVMETTPADRGVLLDLSRVDRFTDVGRRMVLEGLRRVRLEGRSTAIHDPDNTLPDPDLGDGSFAEIRRSVHP
ncbi:glutaminase [Gordonia lacunae]|uniref:Glutaminase n=1 Tax=Gordonia lacunae TaxID=417102 RepID=A0A243QB75_9ACTN|nr:glutaminase [Gordonia lacunae]OUC78086.1 glutaminase A [Gordonia lacunae]